MYFDHLDEIYGMMKSNWQFDKVVHWSDRFIQQVWLVCSECPANLNCGNFGCQRMPPCFLVKLAYQEIFIQSQNYTEIMKSTCAPIISCLRRWRNSINHISWYGSTIVSPCCSCSCIFSEMTSLSTHHLRCKYLKYCLISFSHPQMTMDAQIDQFTINSNLILSMSSRIKIGII